MKLFRDYRACLILAAIAVLLAATVGQFIRPAAVAQSSRPVLDPMVDAAIATEAERIGMFAATDPECGQLPTDKEQKECFYNRLDLENNQVLAKAVFRAAALNRARGK